MALIGQGAQGVGIDYSSVGDSAWKLASANSSAISSAIGTVGDIVKDRRDKKDSIKTSKELAKAMATLYPESAQALEPVISLLDDEETPLSQRAALGAQIGEFINMGVQKSRDTALMDMEGRGMKIREDQFAIDKAAAERESTAVAKAMEDKEALTGFMARPALEQALRETVAAEKRGETPLIGSEKLKSAFLKQPDEQMQIVAAAMQGLPKAAPLEFRDIEFTRDGQPTKGTAVFDPRKGQFNLVPIAEPGVAASSGDLLGFIKGKEGFYAEPYDDYAQTSIGYGTRAKPGETSITKEEAERRLQQEVAQARKGVDRAVAEAGLSLSAPQLDALTSFNYNTGAVDTLLKGGARTPEEIASAMLLYNKAGGKTLPGLVQRRKEESAMFSGGIQPGAARSTGVTKTPTEQKLDEAKLAKIEAETAAATTEKGIAATKVNNTARRVFSVIDKYRDSEGKPTQALRDAVGRGEGFGSGLSSWTGGVLGNDPQTIANQQELELELLETDLLNAAKDLKPVSEDEMKMLLSRRPSITSAPEVWVSFMNRAEKILKDGMITGSGSAPADAATDGLTPTQSATINLNAKKAALQGR